MEPTQRNLYCFIDGLRRNGLKASEIHRMIVRAFGEDKISERRVREVVQEFRDGVRESYDRCLGSGRQVSDKRTDLVDYVRAEIEMDQHISIRRLAAIHDTSYGVMYRIVTEDLECMSFNSRYVPHKLTTANKDRRVTCCTDAMDIFNRRNITQRLIHTDEKWVYCLPMGNSKTRMAWVAPGGDIPMIPRRSSMQEKFMIMVACNFEGLSYFKVVNGTVNAEIYTEFLQEMFTSFGTYELRQAGKAILPENAVLFHDNARPHIAQTTRIYIEQITALCYVNHRILQIRTF